MQLPPTLGPSVCHLRLSPRWCCFLNLAYQSASLPSHVDVSVPRTSHCVKKKQLGPCSQVAVWEVHCQMSFGRLAITETHLAAPDFPTALPLESLLHTVLSFRHQPFNGSAWFTAVCSSIIRL